MNWLKFCYFPKLSWNRNYVQSNKNILNYILTIIEVMNSSGLYNISKCLMFFKYGILEILLWFNRRINKFFILLYYSGIYSMKLRSAMSYFNLGKWILIEYMWLFVILSFWISRDTSGIYLSIELIKLATRIVDLLIIDFLIIGVSVDYSVKFDSSSSKYFLLYFI